MNKLKQLPSVDKLLQHAGAIEPPVSRDVLVSVIREVVENARENALKGGAIPTDAELQQAIAEKARFLTRPAIQRVINATGVILHTNLGRAPIASEALDAARAASEDYSNLEYNLGNGKRGQRLTVIEQKLIRLTGAEAGLVVNNNAASLLLILSAFARRKEVIISRTQMIEIGDGFRIPDIMRQSGTRLVEVGSTNRVHLADFESAVSPASAAILRAHHSNYKIIGFTAEPSLAELTSIAHRHNLLLIDDLGSGTLLDTACYGLAHEPTIQESVQAGVDLVCFSGDKLLGGPQAGIIVGKKAQVDKLRKHPLMRALRADKLILAALDATLSAYFTANPGESVPVWRMISAKPAALKKRAQNWMKATDAGLVIPGYSTVGGGSLPEEQLATFLFALTIDKPDSVLKQLRQRDIPIIARIEDDKIVFDPRTVREQDDSLLIDAINELINP